MEPIRENSFYISSSSLLEAQELLHCSLPEMEIQKV